VASRLVESGTKLGSRPYRLGKRAFGATFSRGEGYEPQPPGLLFERDLVRGYFIDYRSKTTAKTAQVPERLPPAALAQLALGWHERMLLGDRRGPTKFTDVCELLVRRAEDLGDQAVWPYEVAVPKYGAKAPWYSGMAQGQAASVFVRAYVRTGSERYETLARRAIEPLLQKDARFVAVTEAGPVLQEGDTQPPSHILNGWVFALWGLWDICAGLGDPRAEQLLQATIDCLASKLDSYDTGWWTRYSLFPHRLPDLAKPFYHRLHIHQMDVLYRLTGISEFGMAAHRWTRYDTKVARLAVLAQKVPFKIIDSAESRAR
jgi:heparosan-N-sulfate-glucuronate 5-epimerase